MTSRPAAPTLDTDAPRPPAPREPVQRWRVVLRRAAVAPGPAQKAWQQGLVEALVASGLPIAGLDAAPARPRIAVAAPLPAGIPGEHEFVDVYLVTREVAWRVRELLNSATPVGDELVACYDVWTGEPPLPGQVTASAYRIEVVATELAPSALAVRLDEKGREMLAAQSLPRMRRKGDALVPYDLRPFLERLEVASPPAGEVIAVRATLRHDPERGIGRPDEVVAELQERAQVALDVRAVVRERLILADELPARLPEGGTRPGEPGAGGAAGAPPAGGRASRPRSGRPPRR